MSTPEIRFKGHLSPWKQHRFDEITFPAGRKNRDNLPYDSFSITNESGFVPQNDKFENGGTMKDADKSLYYIVDPDSFAYNPARINVGSIGYQYLDKPVIVSSLYEVFKTVSDIDNQFLWHWFKTVDFQKLIERLQEGGVRLYFYYDKLCQGVIATPSLEEQKEIGALFNQLDTQITLQEHKLDTIKNYKKAMVVKMFPKEGQKVPEVRFKGFSGDWEQRKLGEVSNRVIVGLATTVTPYYRKEGIPILRNLNIKENYLDDTDILFLERKYAENKISKQIHTGDVLTVHTGYIGTSCVVPKKYDKALTFTTLITTTNEDILNGEFLAQFLNSEIGNSAVQAITSQGGRQNLNTNDFIKVEIQYPSIAEQTVICSVLRQIDSLITLNQHKLYKLKNLKQAMLNKMFVKGGN